MEEKNELAIVITISEEEKFLDLGAIKNNKKINKEKNYGKKII